MQRYVRYVGATQDQVNWGSNDDPRPLLTIGETYAIEKISVHSWHTKISLQGFPGLLFNDASFEYIKKDAAKVGDDG